MLFKSVVDARTPDDQKELIKSSLCSDGLKGNKTHFLKINTYYKDKKKQTKTYK